MKKNVYETLVKEVMSRHVITINARATVQEAMELMVENKVHALPVVDHRDRCVGILSSSDFVDVTYDLDAGLDLVEHAGEVWWSSFIKKIGDHVGHQSVMDLMTEDVVSVGPETKVVDAAARMLRGRIHRLPVLDEQGKLLGITSTSDILRALVDGTPQ